MAVRGPDHLVGIGDTREQLLEALAPQGRQGIAHGIRHVDGSGAGLDHRIEHAHQEIDVGTHRVLGGKFHIVGIFLGPFHGLHRPLHHLVRRHAQLVFHMDGTGGDKGVDAAELGGPDGLACAAHIVFAGARQRAHRGILDDFGNGADRLEITRAGGSEARLDDIHAKLFQLARDADFFFLGHRSTRALLAVAQRGIENDQFVLHGMTPFCLRQHAS